MGVRNGGDRLKATVNSILAQEDVDLEFIVVNDGSNDCTCEILDRFSNLDSRVKIFSSTKQGLTASLIQACSIAKGVYIARQDAGDISLPGRLKTQLEVFEKEKDTVLCSTHVRFVTEEGITALTNLAEQSELSNGLKGIIHGSIMMRRNEYNIVGGYRRQFYYAQDVDLWSRLVEVGGHQIVPRIYYEGLLFPDSISGTRKLEQSRFFSLIEGATRSRLRGESESDWLEKAASYSRYCQTLRSNPKHQASGAYFIGACLYNSNPTVAKRYFEMALQKNPSHIRARIKLATLS